jgi:hypothetical protein
MTKKLIISLFLTFALLILSNVESNGQCNPCQIGYTPKSFNYQVTETSCTITVNYCAFCAPTGNPIVKLCSITIPHDNDCKNLNLTNFEWNKIKEAMVSDAANSCIGIPPCPTQITTEVYQAECYRLENDWINGMVWILPCESEAGECRQNYQVCWNGSTLQVIKHGHPVLIDEGDCLPDTIIIDPDDLYENCFNTCY